MILEFHLLSIQAAGCALERFEGLTFFCPPRMVSCCHHQPVINWSQIPHRNTDGTAYSPPDELVMAHDERYACLPPKTSVWDLGEIRRVSDIFKCPHKRKIQRRKDRTKADHGYCNEIKIGISPWPSVRGRNALPITAPKAFIGSSALMA